VFNGQVAGGRAQADHPPVDQIVFGMVSLLARASRKRDRLIIGDDDAGVVL
jgi:hypothetical protein